MDKFAKYSPKWKPSADPVQDKLRSMKAHWNGKVSEFIENFLNFKWLFNGRPSTFHGSTFSLFEKIPADPATIIGVLDLEFKEIVREANQIISFQENYSKTRKRKVTTAVLSHNLLFAEALDHKELMSNKKNWNKKHKEFINDLVNFVWLMNGKSNKFLSQKSVIGEPLPSDPSTIIGSLELDFSDLVKQANSIIDYQDNLVEEKKSKKSSALRKQILNKYSSNEDLFLQSYGSSRFSRALTRWLTPTLFSSKAEVNKIRLTLLASAARADAQLKEFLDLILKDDRDKSFSAKKFLDSVYDNLVLLRSDFKNFSDSLPAPSTNSGSITGPQTINAPSSPSLPSRSNQSVAINPAAPPAVTSTAPPSPGAMPGGSSQPLADVAMQTIERAKKIQSAYENMTKQLVDDISAVPDPEISATLFASLKSLRDAYLAFFEAQTKGSSLSESLTAADNLINSWSRLKDKITQHANLVPGLASNEKIFRYASRLGQYFDLISQKRSDDPLSLSRIQAYQKAKEMRQELDKIMDILEKDIDVASLSNLITNVFNLYNAIYSRVQNILSPRGIGQDYSKTYLDLIRDKKIDQISTNLSSEDLGKVEKGMRQSAIRDLVNKGKIK